MIFDVGFSKWGVRFFQSLHKYHCPQLMGAIYLASSAFPPSHQPRPPLKQMGPACLPECSTQAYAAWTMNRSRGSCTFSVGQQAGTSLRTGAAWTMSWSRGPCTFCLGQQAGAPFRTRGRDGANHALSS